MRSIKSSTIDVTLLTLMVLFPIFNMRAVMGIALTSWGDYINEFVYVCLGLFTIAKIIRERYINLSIGWILLFLGYFLLQILILQLPITSFWQAIIYLQTPVYFYYFYNKSRKQKQIIITSFSNVIKWLSYIVIIVAAIECIAPEFVSSITMIKYTNRGIDNWFYIGSIFGSNIALAQFCILSITMYFINRALYGKKTFNSFIIISLFIMMFLVFSRKEMVLFAVYSISMLFLLKFKKLNFKIIMLLIVCIIPFILLYISNYFNEANYMALTDDYIRLRIFLYAKEIFITRFPFGSGVGTFGSQMSLSNQQIYNEFNVDSDIIGIDSRGPIYDLFLPTFTAEIGIGILIFILFFIYLWRLPTLTNNFMLKHIKTWLIIIFLILCVFAPLWMNSFGLLTITILALISDQKYVETNRLSKNSV